MKNNINTEADPYIRVYPNAVSSDDCDLLIQIYEDNIIHNERIDHNGRPTFTQLNISSLHEENIGHATAIPYFLEYKERYMKELNISEYQFPEKHGWEQIRIKKYEKETTDQFMSHVDVGDHASAKRFLAMFVYLNTVVIGGETNFGDLTITPDKGTMVVFPPFWMFSHSGERPITSDKYIMTTYCHYL